MRKYTGYITHFVLLAYVAVTIYPIFFAFYNALKPTLAVISNPFALPKTLFLDNFINVWSKSHLSTYFVNSLYISIICSVASMILASMVSYAVTRMRFKWLNRVVFAFLGLNLMIPGAFLIIPLYFLVVDLGIYNTPLALILPYITFGIPLTVFIIAAFLKSLPAELEEAGIMDGLSAFGLFWRIVLPLMIPALVTVFILNYLGNWNEFILANFYLSKEKYRTLPVAMNAFKDSFNMNYGNIFAATMFSIVPVIVIYAILQKRIIDGLTAGSVKG